MIRIIIIFIISKYDNIKIIRKSKIRSDNIQNK